MSTKLEQFESIVNLLDKETPSVDEVAEAIQAILAHIEEMRQEMAKNMAQMDSSMTEKHAEMMRDMGTMEVMCQRLGRLIVEVKDEAKSDKDALSRQIYVEIQNVRDLIPTLPEIKDWAFLQDEIKKVEAKILPELSPEQIRDKIESLKGDERVDKSAIKGLEEELKDIRTLASSRPSGGGAARYVNVPMVDNFTSLTDGSTKQFYLSKAPKVLETMKLWGSDFPHIMTHGNGFTVSGKLLTIATDVDAPTAGAILVVEYYS